MPISAPIAALRPSLSPVGPDAAAPALTPLPGASPPRSPPSATSMSSRPAPGCFVAGRRSPQPAPSVAAAASSRRATVSSATAATALRVSVEVEKYWRQVLEDVDKPAAKRLLDSRIIEPGTPLGLRDPGEVTSGRSSKAILIKDCLKAKERHPAKVILARNGDAYEAVGIDAVLLLQHAEEVTLGAESDPPRVQIALSNLHSTLEALVYGAGLSVVVSDEERGPYSFSEKIKGMKRFITEVVTPATPHFLRGLIDEDADVSLEGAPPLLGVVPRSGGFDVVEIDAEMRTVRVT